jgi:hypothetical protein
MNPECRDGKHTLCNGDGLDAATDTIFPNGCPCKCHKENK